ncbi:MAG: hypothetical protein HY904_20960 [Deltaproteobacteria bacterium]|nr:hypothetical protein [Deltaproteobacteria bacterium]
MNRGRPPSYTVGVSFDVVLAQLCRSVPGARGAIFVDHEGEAIQHVVHDPTLAAYDLQVAGAYVAPLLAHAMAPRQLHVHGVEGNTFIQVVTETYAVVLLATTATPTWQARVALHRCARDLLVEM